MLVFSPAFYLADVGVFTGILPCFPFPLDNSTDHVSDCSENPFCFRCVFGKKIAAKSATPYGYFQRRGHAQIIGIKNPGISANIKPL
jgi:hypothetical protein